MKMSSYYLIAITVKFPEGVCPGDGLNGSNILMISRNGSCRPVIRGSALAGVFRDAFRNYSNDDHYVNKWFGYVSDDNGVKKMEQSHFKLHDLEFNEIDQNHSVPVRTHNAINRHTGAVINGGGLFSIEYLPPNISGNIVAELEGLNDEECICFINNLKDLLGENLFFGGNRNRGIGRAVFSKIRYNAYDCSNVSDYAELLDSKYYLNKTGKIEYKKEILVKNNENDFVISVKLAIPRGEDFVIGYGPTLSNTSEPQWVKDASGKKYWRIPGSSIRGVFRSWMTRLAALDKEKTGKITDDAGLFRSGENEIKGDNIGWGFIEKEEERKKYLKNPELLDDPILSLFGSLYKRGRIHFSDVLAEVGRESESQVRKHVAIDSFSGAANEGALFENMVLVSPDISFNLNIRIKQNENPQKNEKEIQWLFQTLKSLHLGIISIGSSKGSGRLIIKDIRANSNYQQDKIRELCKFIKDNHD